MANNNRQLTISKKYLRFFIKNTDSRWVIVQGGRRSGKSYSIIQWLWFLASATPNTDILMVAASFPALQLLIADFQRATGLNVEGSTIYGYNRTLSNGSKFIFKSFDDYTKAQGTMAHYMFIDETLNVPIDIITTLSMGISKQIFAAYNPTKTSHIDTYILPDKSNYLCTTWKDNDYLTDEQKEEFEGIRKRAMKPTATIMDQYYYQVYYLGNFSEMSGKVFNLIYTCTDQEYDRIPSREIYGLDFGLVESKDMTTLVGCKVHNNCLYLKEYLYDNGSLYNDRKLAFALHNLGINEYNDIVADYGGMGKTRITNLVTAQDGEWTEPEICRGFSVSNARKGKIIDGIQRMLNYDKILVTESSTNLRKEMDNYELKPSGEPTGKDHAIDAARYAVNSYSMFCY